MKTEMCITAYLFWPHVWNLQLNCIPFNSNQLLSGMKQYISDLLQETKIDSERQQIPSSSASCFRDELKSCTRCWQTVAERNVQARLNWYLLVQSHICLDFQPFFFGDHYMLKNKCRTDKSCKQLTASLRWTLKMLIFGDNGQVALTS